MSDCRPASERSYPSGLKVQAAHAMLQMHGNNCPAHALIATSRLCISAIVLKASDTASVSGRGQATHDVFEYQPTSPRAESSGINPSGSRKAQFGGMEGAPSAATIPGNTSLFLLRQTMDSKPETQVRPETVVRFVGIKINACFPSRKESKRVSQTRKQV